MSTTQYIFLTDGGASKTQSALCRADGRILARARTGACNLFQDWSAGLGAVWDGYLACCAEAGLDAADIAPITAISAGLAGVNAPEAPERFAARFAHFAARHLSSDGYATLACAFPDGPGALLSIGTGTVGCRFDAHGVFTSLGGWGFPIGDQGGGAWIGFTALQRWLQHRDGVIAQPLSQSLWDALAGMIGPDRPTILGWLRGAPPARFAGLAPLILSHDSPAARALRAEAADHLRHLAQALLGPDIPALAVAGGLAAYCTEALADRLAPVTLRLLEADSLDGLLHIAHGKRPAEFAGSGRFAGKVDL